MFDAGKACFSVLFAFYVNWIGVPVYFTNYGYLVNEKIINIKMEWSFTIKDFKPYGDIEIED